jgi:uncharacterized protein (TIGR02265 family)
MGPRGIDGFVVKLPPDLAVRPSVPFLGDLDVESHACAMPPSYRVRGVFFARCVGDLGRDALARLPLAEPTSEGRYLPFTEYPTSDYMRVFGAAAALVHPAADAREAWRRYAREEVVGFSRTMLGGVTLGLMSDPTAALVRYPEVFRVLARGPSATATMLDERAVAIEIRDAFAPIEYTVGVLEGIVLLFKRHPRIEVESLDEVLRFDVRWTI